MKTDDMIATLSRQFATAAGMPPDDLAQELRIYLHTHGGEAKAEALLFTTLRRHCYRLIRHSTARPALLTGEASAATMAATEAPDSDPAALVEREAEEETLERMRPEIEAARGGHRPIPRAGIGREEWVRRLTEKAPRFPAALTQRAVDAMLRIAPEDSRRAALKRLEWRTEAFKRGAGAMGRPGVIAGKPYGREPLVSGNYATDEEARRANSAANLAKHFDADTVTKAVAARDDYITGSRIREAQYAVVAREQMSGLEDAPAGTRQ